MTNLRIIKKYSNRKLYDEDTRSYVTLRDVSSMIKRGEDIKIIDNRTKNDITAVTLSRIILENEKSSVVQASPAVLKQLIQRGTRLSKFLEDFLTVGAE